MDSVCSELLLLGNSPVDRYMLEAALEGVMVAHTSGSNFIPSPETISNTTCVGACRNTFEVLSETA